MSNDIGGVSMGAAVGLVITVSVLILCISVYGLYANYHYSAYHIGIFTVLQLLVMVMGAIVAVLVYNQVAGLDEYIALNFDAGTHIRSDIGACFCNQDEGVTCSQIKCNRLDATTNLPVHYGCVPNAAIACEKSHDSRCMDTPQCTARLGDNWSANLASLGCLALYALLFLVANAFVGSSLRRRIKREEAGEAGEMDTLLMEVPPELPEEEEEERPPARGPKRHHRRTNSGSYLPDLEASWAAGGANRVAPRYQPEISAAVSSATKLSVDEIDDLLDQLEAVKQAKLLQGCQAVVEEAHGGPVGLAVDASGSESPPHSSQKLIRRDGPGNPFAGGV